MFNFGLEYMRNYFLEGENNMFCANCGKYSPDTEKKCLYCGSDNMQKEEPKVVIVKKDKYDVGSLLALFLNLIGLIFVFILYPKGSNERKTCLNGWVKTFVTVIIFVAIMLLLGNCLNASCAKYNFKA